MMKTLVENVRSSTTAVGEGRPVDITCDKLVLTNLGENGDIKVYLMTFE